MKESIYALQRNLDGIYFRVKRNDKWCTVCISDLTEEEIAECLADFDKEAIIKCVIHLAKHLRNIGDEFDLVREDV